MSWFVARRWDSAADSLRFCLRDWACRAWRDLKRSCRSRAFWAAVVLSSSVFACGLLSAIMLPSAVASILRFFVVECGGANNGDIVLGEDESR